MLVTTTQATRGEGSSTVQRPRGLQDSSSCTLQGGGAHPHLQGCSASRARASPACLSCHRGAWGTPGVEMCPCFRGNCKPESLADTVPPSALSPVLHTPGDTRLGKGHSHEAVPLSSGSSQSTQGDTPASTQCWGPAWTGGGHTQRGWVARAVPLRWLARASAAGQGHMKVKSQLGSRASHTWEVTGPTCPPSLIHPADFPATPRPLWGGSAQGAHLLPGVPSAAGGRGKGRDSHRGGLCPGSQEEAVLQ